MAFLSFRSFKSIIKAPLIYLVYLLSKGYSIVIFLLDIFVISSLVQGIYYINYLHILSIIVCGVLGILN